MTRALDDVDLKAANELIASRGLRQAAADLGGIHPSSLRNAAAGKPLRPSLRIVIVAGLALLDEAGKGARHE
jgi:hypothetical protein